MPTELPGGFVHPTAPVVHELQTSLLVPLPLTQHCVPVVQLMPLGPGPWQKMVPGGFAWSEGVLPQSGPGATASRPGPASSIPPLEPPLPLLPLMPPLLLLLTLPEEPPLEVPPELEPPPIEPELLPVCVPESVDDGSTPMPPQHAMETTRPATAALKDTRSRRSR